MAEMFKNGGKNLYPGTESKYLEFKEKVSTKTGFKSIAKECVAFANAVGGKIVIGMSDAGKVIGLSEKAADDVLERAAEAVFSLTSPPIQILTKRIEIEDKILVEITVPRGLAQIFYLKSQMNKDIPYAGVYFRVGKSSLPITDKTQYDSIEGEKLKKQIDEGPIFSDQDYDELLDKKELQSAFGRTFTESTLIANKVLIPNALHSEALHVTIAAIIAFGHIPDQNVPEALVRVTQFKGISGRDIIMTRDITGPLRRVVNDTILLIGEWTEVNFKLEKAAFKGKSPIPEVALREAIVNALIHRKYEYRAPVKVAIFQDRIEIFSPGDLPAPILPENLGDGSSQIRNHLLVKFARKLRLVESLGSGVSLMRQECDKADIEKPIFNNEGDYLKVVFSFQKDNSQKGSASEILKKIMSEKEIIVASDLIAAGVAERTASRILNQAVKNKVLEKVGDRKGARYLVVD